MNKRIATLSGSAVAAVAVALTPMTSASGSTRTWTCQDGGHTLTNTVHYTTDSTTHTWGYLTYKLGGAGTGGKSNWNASFTDGSGTRNFAANNQDDLDNNVLYTEQFANFTSPRSRTETWSASAAFDTRGTDNHCKSSTSW